MGKSPAPILTARSLAIVGATERSHWPTNIFANLKKSGFPGPVWPVNPRRDEVWGEKCYPDIEALPEAPELALWVKSDSIASGDRELRQGSFVIYQAQKVNSRPIRRPPGHPQLADQAALIVRNL